MSRMSELYAAAFADASSTALGMQRSKRFGPRISEGISDPSRLVDAARIGSWGPARPPVS